MILALALLLAGCAPPPEVEVLRPVRGDLERSFTEQARTRLSRTFLVTMPVAGRLSRVAVDEGDGVRAGQALATVDPVPLESRVAAASAEVEELRLRAHLQEDTGVEAAERRQAEARVEAERQASRALRAQVRAAEAAREDARIDRERREGLYAQGFVTRQDVEDARLAEVAAAQDLAALHRRIAAQDAAAAAASRGIGVIEEAAARRTREADALRQQAEAASARLRESVHEAERAVVEAPVAGVVLRRFEAGPGEFPAGTRLVEIGRMSDLEVVAEVLTGDALALRPGMPVRLSARDGASSFAGVVRAIEPAGFTKLSSLGVEQQRVEVLLRVPDPPRGLGVGWRVTAEFVTGSRRGVLLVPRFSVLQDVQGGYACFVVEDGRLARRLVRLGLQGEAQLEVTAGLSEADRIVAVPDATLQEGRRVTPAER